MITPRDLLFNGVFVLPKLGLIIQGRSEALPLPLEVGYQTGIANAAWRSPLITTRAQRLLKVQAVAALTQIQLRILLLGLADFT